MQNHEWFRDDVYRPPQGESQVEREIEQSVARTARIPCLFLLSAVALIAILMLHWLVQVFTCDFREVLFPGMARRAPWLCRLGTLRSPERTSFLPIPSRLPRPTPAFRPHGEIPCPPGCSKQSCWRWR